LEKVHKDAITSVHVISDAGSSATDEQGVAQKIVSTALDGFIKMLDARDGSVKKAFFVCQSGINSSTSLSSQDSFALAAQNHNIYVFSFLTGTTITNFYAHDDIINKVLFSNVSLLVLLLCIEQTDHSVERPDPARVGSEGQQLLQPSSDPLRSRGGDRPSRHWRHQPRLT
jgi:hypothetical protein